MSIEAMKQALEALEANRLLVNGDDKKGGLVWCMDGYYSGCFDIEAANKQTNVAITALRTAIEAAEKQEPVCDKDPRGCWSVRCQLGKVCKNTSLQPQREWVGLTDEEFRQACWSSGLDGLTEDREYACRAIEAKLKEKNT